MNRLYTLNVGKGTLNTKQTRQKPSLAFLDYLNEPDQRFSMLSDDQFQAWQWLWCSS